MKSLPGESKRDYRDLVIEDQAAEVNALHRALGDMQATALCQAEVISVALEHIQALTQKLERLTAQNRELLQLNRSQVAA